MFFLWVFLINLLVYSANCACPPAGAIFPCTCVSIEDRFGREFPILSCYKINSDYTLKRVLEATKGYRMFELELVNSSLNYIAHDAFLDTTYEFIKIENSSFDSLSDSSTAFTNLYYSLRMLEIKNCTFTSSWNWTHLSHLKNMAEVFVENTNFPDLVHGLHSVKNMSFTNLVFMRNNIKWLDSHAFESFKFLYRLTLDRNSIEQVERSMFPRPANHLDILGLSYNKLTSLPSDLFVDMPALTRLSLTGNPLRTIDEWIFKPVWNQMTFISFNDTALSCDCKLSWIKQIDNTNKHIHADCHSPAHVKGKPVSRLQIHELWCYFEN